MWQIEKAEVSLDPAGFRLTSARAPAAGDILRTSSRCLRLSTLWLWVHGLTGIPGLEGLVVEHAAINQDDLAGDVVGVLGGEE